MTVSPVVAPVDARSGCRAMRRWCRALGLVACLPGAALAANLSAIVQLARDNDAEYAASRAIAAASRERLPQARAGVLPTINFTAGGRAVEENNSSIDHEVAYHSGNAALTVTQPLLRRANIESLRQGEIQASQAELQLKLAEQDLLLRVSRGYFDVLQAQNALESVRAQKDAFTEQLAQANKSYSVGLVPVTDVNEAQSRYDLTLAQEIAALNEVEVKRRALEKSIRQELPPLATLDDASPVDILTAEQLSELATRASADALQVQIASASEDIARHEVAKQKAAWEPTLDLVLNRSEGHHASYNATGPQNLRQSTIGLELAIPIYQGGAITSRERESAANFERARAELDGARLQSTFDARQALLGVQSGSALHQALRQALSSNETQVRSTRRGLDVGVRTRVDVLNAEQQFYATRRDLAAARYQTLVSGLQLKAAAGALTDEDLRRIDALLKD